MPSKLYPFDTPSNYTYNTSKIEIVNGIVKLKDQRPPNATFYASYDNNLNANWCDGDPTGVETGGVVIVNKKADLTGYLDKKIDYNADLNADHKYIGCIRIKITPNYSGVPGKSQWFFAIGRADGNNRNLISLYHYTNGNLYLLFKDKDGTTIFQASLGYWSPASGQEYEFELNYDLINGETRLFIDGQQFGLTISNTNSNKDDNIGLLRIGQNVVANPSLNAPNFYANDLIIFSTVQHTSNYTPGESIPLTIYPADKPTIKPISSWSVQNLYYFSGFSHILGGNNQGNIGYQLSDDDGVTWKYWDGAVWQTANNNSYNDVSTVNQHIQDFPTTNGKILFKAFLISNGNEQCELDSVEITALDAQAPLVYAGADKECYDNQTIEPFSDATISDPDGDIENAHAYYNIEGSGWIEIPKDNWGTLQEAVRNFEYSFNNPGTILCQLKIIDEQSAEAIDNLNIIVKKYTVTFNIKDSDGNHLANLLFNPGDGSDWQQVNSPFTWDYEYSPTNYIAVIDKVGFNTVSFEVPPTVHTENIVLTKLGAVSPDEVADAVWDELISNHIQTGSFGELMNLFKEQMQRLLGLSFENYRILNPSYDSLGKLISAKIRIYNSKSDCENNINYIAEYKLSATYDSEGKLSSYTVVKL